MLTSKYIFLNKLKILIYKLTIISEKFVAQNINYKGARYKQIHGERKNEIFHFLLPCGAQFSYIVTYLFLYKKIKSTNLC